ncbi:MAG TPA: hypothetical protein VFO33_10010 [Casimicrobiaceae bacterium]|nr:hypothetical protein [Casimicrobiaceae bacterium]
MRISAHFALWGAIVFALVCLYVAWDGFSSLDGLTNPQAREDARGFAWFWLFLAGVGGLAGVASWWILRSSADDS